MTEDCNLRCTYCYVPHVAKTMTIETIDQSIKFLEEELLSRDENFSFDLFGGEPTLAFEECKALIGHIEKLKEKYPKKNFNCMIFTNCTNFDHEKLKYLKTKEFIRYNFSLDGHSVANSCRMFPDGSNSFQAVVDNVKLFKEYYPKSNIVFKSMVSPQNVRHMADTAEKMMEIGYPRISFSLVRDDVWSDENIAEYERQLKRLATFYHDNIDKGAWYDILNLAILDKDANKVNRGYCSAGKNMYAITPEGDIYPCQRFYNNRSPYRLGNIWEGLDKNNRWANVFKRYTLFNFVGCTKCDTFKFNCTGTCIAAQYEASGNLFQPIESICKIIKINNKVAHKLYHKLKDNEHYKKVLDIRKYGG